MSSETVVRARIDAGTKARATQALSSMGLTISDAIRLLLLRVADEQRLPFEIKAPNKDTRRAIEELSNGQGERFESAEAMFKDLGL